MRYSETSYNCQVCIVLVEAQDPKPPNPKPRVAFFLFRDDVRWEWKLKASEVPSPKAVFISITGVSI